MGGVECRVEAEGECPAWVPGVELTKELRQQAKQAAWAPSSFYEHARQRQREGVRGMTKATWERIIQTCEKSGDASEDEMRELWEAFCAHADGVAAHGDEVKLTNMVDATTEGGKRGRTWTCEPWRTVYLGGREDDPDMTEAAAEQRKAEKPNALEGRACMSLDTDQACPDNVPHEWRVTDDVKRLGAN